MFWLTKWKCPVALKVTAAFFFAVIAIAIAPLMARAVTISTDTIIDAASPLNGEEITVVDGVGGSTSVRIVEGGSVAGFFLQDSSEITLDGGEVTFLSGLTDQSKLTLLGGRISCSEPSCRLINPFALLSATDSAAIEVRGGQIDFNIRLEDHSTITVVGSDLSLSEFGGRWFINGTLADGTNLNGSLVRWALISIAILLDAFSSCRCQSQVLDCCC